MFNQSQYREILHHQSVLLPQSVDRHHLTPVYLKKFLRIIIRRKPTDLPGVFFPMCWFQRKQCSWDAGSPWSGAGAGSPRAQCAEHGWALPWIIPWECSSLQPSLPALLPATSAPLPSLRHHCCWWGTSGDDNVTCGFQALGSQARGELLLLPW